MLKNLLTKEYSEFLDSLKLRVATSRYQAARAVNKELILLYHQIGTEILARQAAHGWGAKIIDQLSRDLSSSFPEMRGFSSRNLKYMRLFAQTYPDPLFVQTTSAQLTWHHNVTLLDKIKDPEARLFYTQSAIKYGWSTPVMVHQIELNLFKRQGKSINNFKESLPFPQSDLANQTLKDHYIFDFLSIGKEAHEREIEKSLIQHMEKFLLELGEGFAYIGKQYHLQVGDQDFYIDLLFYHLKLRSYIVIELKADTFQPEHAGKMNFYLSAVDDILKHPSDNPSIGLILCKTKDKVLAEYTLRDINKAIGLAEYQITQILPENLKTELPLIEELENELSGDTSKSNIEASAEWQEDRAAQIILPEIKEHLDYLNSVYNLCFEAQYLFNNKPLRDISDTTRAQMMILMRITDFIRCVQFLVIKGYPEQAGTLSATVFELAHTAIYFSHTMEAATQWLKSTSIKDEMPKFIGVNTYRGMVEKNCENLGFDPEPEVKIYKQLCWMKHSLPKMQDMIKDRDSVIFQFGPYSNERSINHAWFSLEHAGRLTELLLNAIIQSFKDATSIKEKLFALTKVRINLDEKAKKRFGTQGPFVEDFA